MDIDSIFDWGLFLLCCRYEQWPKLTFYEVIKWSQQYWNKEKKKQLCHPPLSLQNQCECQCLQGHTEQLLWIHTASRALFCGFFLVTVALESLVPLSGWILLSDVLCLEGVNLSATSNRCDEAPHFPYSQSHILPWWYHQSHGLCGKVTKCHLHEIT